MCHDHARELFGVEPTWWPQGPMVRRSLEAELNPSDFAEDMPGIIDAELWCLNRTGFRSTIPVLGRHSRDNWTKWPADRETLLAVYPDRRDVDVRIMGGTAAVQALLGSERVCRNWLAYDYDEVDVRSFLFQLDFYVYFPHPTMVEAFGRAILEAIASGCVTILPDRFADTFGDAAVYCDPTDVGDVVARFYGSRELFLEQSRLGQARVRERFSHDAYADRILDLIGRS
jgi:glycosyltransferase involved in cell wall biosynthesis